MTGRPHPYARHQSHIRRLEMLVRVMCDYPLLVVLGWLFPSWSTRRLFTITRIRLEEDDHD